MNNDAIFDDISIMGRVIYIIYVIEKDEQNDS